MAVELRTSAGLRGAQLGRPVSKRWVLLAPALVLVAVVFVFPLGWIGYLSFTEPEPGIGNYTSLFTDSVTLETLKRTLGMALLVTLVCLLFSYPYAYAMTIASPRLRGILLLLVLLPFWTSLMARTFAWVVLLQQGGPLDSIVHAVTGLDVVLKGTTTGVTIAMAQVMMPFMALPLYSTLQTIDLRLVDAAKSLGATNLISFVKVYLPLSLGGVFAGASIVFVISLGFYVTPALLATPRTGMISQLMALKVDPLLQFGAAGALAFFIVVVTALCVGLAAWAARGKNRSSFGGGIK